MVEDQRLIETARCAAIARALAPANPFAFNVASAASAICSFVPLSPAARPGVPSSPIDRVTVQTLAPAQSDRSNLQDGATVPQRVDGATDGYRHCLAEGCPSEISAIHAMLAVVRSTFVHETRSRRAWWLARSPGSVDVSAMFDAQYNDLAWLLAYSVEDAIGPAPCRPHAEQLAPKWLSHTPWLSDQGGRQELDHGRGHRL